MLRIDNLEKYYGETLAVDKLSLSVNPGEIFGLLGPNGAGKTTTVQMAVGFLKPDRGTIHIGGAGSPESATVRRRIGIAPQSLSLYADLTADENLEFFAALYNLTREMGREKLAQRITDVLDSVGLTNRRNDRVKTFSGGMKRRLNIAVAVLHQPDLLILDEPTAGVDPQSRNAILETTERLRDQGKTIIYTTHYMEEAQRVCNRVAIIDHGKILEIDTVDGLIDNHGGISTLSIELADRTLAIETDEPLAELNRVANSETIVRFHVERPTLEEVFLNLTGKSLRD